METKTMFQDLVEILKEEIQLYRTLIDLLQQEQKSLIQTEMETLEELLKKKETLFLQIKLQEECRMTLIQKISSDLQLEEKEIILSRLIEVCDNPCSSELKQCQHELKGLVASVTDLTEMNARLIGGSLEFLKGSLSLLNSMLGGAPGYQQDGRIVAGTDTANVINQKV